MAGKKRVRRTRAAKKGGHPFLVLLFFIALIMGSAYMTDRMTNAPDSEVAQNVTTIGHLFNDKEMQGLVPKEDQGTPESVKEKIKAAMDKVVTVQVKADDEEPAGSSVSSNEKRMAARQWKRGKRLPSVCLLLCLKLQEKRKAMKTQRPLLPCRESQRKRLPPLFHLPLRPLFLLPPLLLRPRQPLLLP